MFTNEFYYDVSELESIPKDYRHWFLRFVRVLTVFRTGKIPNSFEQKACQIFLLEAGQVNASFNIEELNRLNYQKFPFNVTHDHTYLRSNDTLSMSILSIDYRKQLNHTQLSPIWVDSQCFWDELRRYNKVILKLPSYPSALWQEVLKKIQNELKANDGELLTTYWVGIAKPSSEYNLADQLEKQKQDDLDSIELPQSERRKVVYFFKDKFKGVEAIVVKDNAEAYKLVNSLGYRAEPLKILYKLLEGYGRLFFDEKITEDFWQKFSNVNPLNKPGFPSEEREKLKKLKARIKEAIRSSRNGQAPNFPINFSPDLSLPQVINDINGLRMSKQFALYRSYILSYLERYQEIYQAGHFIRDIADSETKLALIDFHEAAKIDDLASAIPAVQTIAEIMQLDLRLSNNFPSYASVLQQSMQKKYPIKRVVLTSYAMRSFVRVLQITENQQPRSVAVTTQSYYELIENLQRIRRRSYSIRLIRHSNDVHENDNIIFLEPHPNNVVVQKQYALDIVDFIKKIKHWGKKYRTLVLDITLNNIADDEVSSILDEALPLISSGYLNLILIQSCTKFLQLGLDKRSAGCIMVINEGEFWQSTNQQLDQISLAEPVDRDIDSFFSYFMVHHQQALKHYIQQINQNVRFVYNRILDQINFIETQDLQSFQITMSDDPKACYVAINMHGLLPKAECQDRVPSFLLRSDKESTIDIFSACLMRDFIIPLCEFHSLPITQRFSIGFPLTSANIVYESIRFTIGIESTDKLELYADILAYIAFVLNRQRTAKVFLPIPESQRRRFLNYFSDDLEGYLIDNDAEKLKAYLAHNELEEVKAYLSDKELRKLKGYLEHKELPKIHTEEALRDYFIEKVKQYKAMTSRPVANTESRYSFIFYRNISQDFSCLPDKYEAIADNGRFVIYYTPKYLKEIGNPGWYELTENFIKMPIRGQGQVSLADPRITMQQRRMIVACLGARYQNVNLEITNMIGHGQGVIKYLNLSSMEMLGVWNISNVYGPFCANSNNGYFLLHEKRMVFLYRNIWYIENQILVRQGDKEYLLSDMPLEDRENIIREGYYEVDRSAFSFRSDYPNIKMPDFLYMPRNNYPKINISDNFIIIEHDKVCYSSGGLTAYSRRVGLHISSTQTLIEFDNWGDKDPELLRFLNLMSAVVMKEKYRISFIARDARYRRFIFNLLEELISEKLKDAIELVASNKHQLEQVLKNYSPKRNHRKVYSFDQIPSSGLSWPNGLVAVQEAECDELILNAYKIIK